MNHITTNFNEYNHIFCFHICILIGGLLPFPFASVLLAWFYWLYKGGRKNWELSEQACRALNFQFLIQSIVFVYGVIVWTYFINVMTRGGNPDYVLIVPAAGLHLVAGLAYPLFILANLCMTRKIKTFYPKTIGLFK